MTTAREECAGMISLAVRSGACAPIEAWHMTPREIMDGIYAIERRRTEEMQNLDLLAWLIGQYAALGLGAPGRYPPRPDRIISRASGDAEMQRLMRALAYPGGKGEER